MRAENELLASSLKKNSSFWEGRCSQTWVSYHQPKQLVRCGEKSLQITCYINIFPWCPSSLSLPSYGYFHQPLMIQAAASLPNKPHLKVSHKHDRKSIRFFFDAHPPASSQIGSADCGATPCLWCNNKSNESLCRCGRADHSFAFRNFVSSYGTNFPSKCRIIEGVTINSTSSIWWIFLVLCVFTTIGLPKVSDLDVLLWVWPVTR